jgi:DeoD family purine-nucleoside phosphorylase
MPIHLRAQPGDYATAVLCPGDPRRAEYVAETFMENVKCVNRERGMLGFTGTFEGRPLSVQSVGMGGPSAAIYYEELIQLGATRLLRIGTCGALQSRLAMADVIVAMSATALDSTPASYTLGEPHAPTATYALLESAVTQARAQGLTVHVGAVATADVFYDPDPERFGRLGSRGHLAIEMEVATLYTIAAIRNVQAVAMMTVSDTLVHGETFERISDEELKRGVDKMTMIAARVATESSAP